jgi:CHAD domain-containing protein
MRKPHSLPPDCLYVSFERADDFDRVRHRLSLFETFAMDEPRPATIRSTGRLETHGLRALAVSSRPLRIRKGMTAEDAFRVTLLECLAHVAGNVGAVTRSREVEGLHQLRVGLRRLHVAFAAFGEEFRNAELRDLRKRAKTFAVALAPARDLDVFVDELFAEPVAAMRDDDSFRTLRERANAARDESWNHAVETVSSVDFAIFLDDVAAAAEGRAWIARDAVHGDFKTRLAARAPISSIAARMLDEHLMRARKRGRHMKSLSQRDCHRLRVSLKKLRYAAEFYGPLYGKKKVRRYVARLKRLQDLLGGLNDVAQVGAILSRLISDETTPPRTQADLCFSAGLVNGWHRARAASMGEKALKRWDRFKRAEPFWA